MRTARLAGHFFSVMGVATLLGMIVIPILGGPVRIDFSFILHFWIAWGLLNGRSGYRTVVLVLLTLGVLFFAGYLITLTWATGPVTGSRGVLNTPLLAAVMAAVALIFMLIPLVLLLLPATRQWFAEPGKPRYQLSAKVIGLYGLGAVVVIALAAALEKLPRTVEPSGRGASFQFGDRKAGMAAAQWMEDKATGRVLYVSIVAFMESGSYSTDQYGNFSFGSHAVDLPKLKPVRYLGGPPRDDESRPNVLIVRQNGEVIRLARRVRPEQLESTLAAANNVRDFDELKSRLEALLPP